MEAEKFPIRARGTAHLTTHDSWGASIARYLFGPAPVAEHGEGEALLTEVRRLGGVVSPADVMRVTGLARAAAEALLCRLAAHHGGDVEVSDTGAVIYRFPALARGSRQPQRPVWERPRALAPVTGNELSVDLTLAAVNLLVVAASATVMVCTLASSDWQPAVALVPFTLSLLALALPLSRLTSRHARLRELAQENGRRALLREILERPAGAALGAYALSHAWIAACGRAIRPKRLLEEIRAIGGEPDVDDDARLMFRFPELDDEARAVALERAAG